MEYGYIKSPTSLTVHFDDGASFMWADDHPSYQKACDLVLREDADADAVRELIDARRTLLTAGEGRIRVEEDAVYYEDREIHTTLAMRILQMLSEGYKVDPMLNFLDRVMKSPRESVVQDLYEFLEVGGLPITKDGHFIAYKIVGPDFMDLHSRKFDNSVGQHPKMPANEVDEDRMKTCSRGLHVCSKEYLPAYGGTWNSNGNHVMIVKVDPQDVIAIPRDYNQSKMRTCGYEVVGEMFGEEAIKILESRSVAEPTDDGLYSFNDDADDPDDDYDWGEPDYDDGYDDSDDYDDDVEDDDPDEVEEHEPEPEKPVGNHGSFLRRVIFGHKKD